MLNKVTVFLVVLFTSCINYHTVEDRAVFPTSEVELITNFEHYLDQNGYYHVTVSYDDLFKRLEMLVFINDRPGNNARVEWRAEYNVNIAGTPEEILFLNDFNIINSTSIAKDGVAVTHVYIHPKFIGDTVSIVSSIRYYNYNSEEMEEVSVGNSLVLE